MLDFDCLSIEDGRLRIGGLEAGALAREYGTPLFILDEMEIRRSCQAFIGAMREFYGDNFLVAYASKALCFKEIYRLMHDEGMGVDVVSGGELYTAHSVGFPMERVIFHGNNKTRAEMELALSLGVGRIVADNREELETLNTLAGEMGVIPEVCFRLKPGIEAHTHEFIQTGKIDSKFGFAIENGEAYDAIKRAVSMPHIKPVGVHCHIGSQIFEPEPFKLAVEVLMDFMSAVRGSLGVTLEELNLGGGFGIQYIPSHDPRPLREVVRAATETVKICANKFQLPAPKLVLEPGRSIVGPAGLTVYTVGSVKEIPGIRTYVSVDGGMTDNPRYALYGASYTAVLPERADESANTLVTIAGRCCESGDLVACDVQLPSVKAGDLLAVLATGAYNYSMASHYNRVPKPPIVMVRDGESRLVTRRETYEDVARLDI